MTRRSYRHAIDYIESPSGKGKNGLMKAYKSSQFCAWILITETNLVNGRYSKQLRICEKRSYAFISIRASDFVDWIGNTGF